MELEDNTLKNLVLRLFEIDAIKFGDYKLKTGNTSPFYFDLRVIVSYPDVLRDVRDLLYEVSDPGTMPCEYKVLCGVPYTALPIATAISLEKGIPMLIRRKEAKDYGTKKMLEGVFKKNDNCLIVEDVVTSGTSVLETAKLLRENGLEVTDAVVLINRNQGGTENLENHQIKLRSVMDVDQLVRILVKNNKIEEDVAAKVRQFVKNNQVTIEPPVVESQLWKKSFKARLESITTADSMSRTVLACIERSKSNLCVAVDVKKAETLLSLANKLGPMICCLKTHVDSIEDWNRSKAEELAKVAKELDFLLFEDRKYADIGNTVAKQYAEVVNWADIVTVHGLPGKGVVDGLKSKAASKERGALILTEMSSAGNLFTPAYTEKCMKLCDGSFVFGYVGQSRRSAPADLIQFTPGVNLDASGDNLGQQYVSPEEAVMKRGADVVIVGRGITEADDVAEAAEKYRVAAWNAYQERCGGEK